MTSLARADHPAAPGRRRWRARLAAVLLGTALALLTLEVVMQCIAYGHWRTGRAALNDLDPRRPVVLCLGDSFTYGLGASAPNRSYPEQLADRLDERVPGHWQVVNRGWPGADTGRILAELDHQLSSLQPRLVYLMIGYNNRRAAAREPGDEAPLAQSPSPPRFEWRWRTMELLERIRFAFDADGRAVREAAGRHPLQVTGRWHAGPFDVRFEPDGAAHIGGLECRWEAVGDTLIFDLNNGERRKARWRHESAGLELHADWFARSPILLQPGGADPGPLEGARAALAAGDLGRARALREKVTAPAARLGLTAELAAAEESTTGVDAALDQLRALAAGDVAAAHELIRTALAIGRPDVALAAARARLRVEPRDGFVWQAVLDATGSGIEPGETIALVDRALRATAQDAAWQWKLYATRAGLRERQGKDMVGALTDAIRSALLHGAHTSIASDMLARIPARYREHLVADAIGRLAPTADQRTLIAQIVETATQQTTTAQGTLARELHTIVQRCRERATTLVLLTYPEDSVASFSVRDVAAATATPLLELPTAFAAAARDGGRQRLFAIDGHCNDRGYALIATVVADDVLRRAPR